MNFRFFREAKRAKISKKNKKRIFLLFLHLFALFASLNKEAISSAREGTTKSDAVRRVQIKALSDIT
jgi:hypothetical protein